MQDLLQIKDLSVNVGEKEILKDINLTIRPGEIHVVMGPNGAGKSTLANTIMAHPLYKVTKGDILFEGESILDEAADERARRGIFMSFQAPEEVPGITLENFLRASKMAVTGENIPLLKFKRELAKQMESLDMDPSYAERYLNVGFSGGEKKKSEILQMKVLDPKFVMLDETDSGLDVDAVRIVSKGVSDFMAEDKAFFIITHHREILESIVPDYVHVIIDGRLVKTGGNELVDQIEEKGYNWMRSEVEMDD